MWNAVCNPFLECKKHETGWSLSSTLEEYREHAMSDSVVRRWVRHFIKGRENVHDDPRNGRPPVFNEDLVRAVEEKIQEDNSPFCHSPCTQCFGTERCSACGILASRLNSQRRCLLWHIKKSRHAIQNKWRGMLSWDVMLSDNAHPHTATATQDLFATFGWEQFDHPPYSPDLAPKCFACVPASENVPWWPAVPGRQ
jgi:transposase